MELRSISMAVCLCWLVLNSWNAIKDLVIDINPRTARWVIFILNACIPIFFFICDNFLEIFWIVWHTLFFTDHSLIVYICFKFIF